MLFSKEVTSVRLVSQREIEREREGGGGSERRRKGWGGGSRASVLPSDG